MSERRDEFVVLRRSDVEALEEEWGDLLADPFWRPVEGAIFDPRVMPFGTHLDAAAVQEVWDVFVAPDQATEMPQPVEMRLLMAILREASRVLNATATDADRCPLCGCNCPVCRYSHRPAGPLLSHAVRCDSIQRRPRSERGVLPL